MALLEVGRIVRPHGLKGEVVVSLSTNFLQRLEPGSVLAAERGPEEPPHELEVRSARPHQGRYLVFFAGVSSLEEAEALRGSRLLAEPIEDLKALLVHEVIGAELIDQFGISHGRITAVEANPAADLLVVEGRSYVPSNFVTEHRDGRVIVEVPEGLFD